MKDADDFDDVAIIRIEYDMRPAADAAQARAQVWASHAKSRMFEQRKERALQVNRPGFAGGSNS